MSEFRGFGGVQLGKFEQALDAIETVMAVIPQKGGRIDWRSLSPSNAVNLAHVATIADTGITRGALLVAAAAIRIAARESGRSEREIIAELRKTFARPDDEIAAPPETG